MLISEFTLPQLIDLALVTPQRGVVNFNILYRVLQTIVEETQLKDVKPMCNIFDPKAAREALSAGESNTLKRTCSDVEQILHVSRPQELKSTIDIKTYAQETSEDDVRTETGSQGSKKKIGKSAIELKPGKSKEVKFVKGEKSDETKMVVNVKSSSKCPDDDTASAVPATDSKEVAKTLDTWKAIQFNKRVESIESGFDKLSAFLDKLNHKVIDLETSSVRHDEDIELLKSKITTLQSELDIVKEQSVTRGEFESMKSKMELLEGMKTGATSVREEPGELIASVSNLREKMQFLLNKFGLTYPDDAEPYTLKTIQEGFEKIWNQIYEIQDQGVGGGSGGSGLDTEMPKDQDALLKYLTEEVHWAKEKIERFEIDMKNRESFIGKLQEDIDALEEAKADKREIFLQLDTKASKEDLKLKVDKIEFEYTVEDIGESIEGLVKQFAILDKECHFEFKYIKEELAKKLNIMDNDKLLTPIRNRIRALLHGFMKMQEIFEKVLFPGAAGITKCLACSRPAELVGSKFNACGDYKHIVKAAFPPPPAWPKPRPPDNAAKRQSSSSNSSDSKENVVRRSKDVARHQQMQNEAKTNENKHTMTTPRGKLPDVKPKQADKDTEDILLQGYDKRIYKGVKPREKIGTLPKGIDYDSSELDEMMNSCYKTYPTLPPITIREPRFCGNAHTKTHPLQRGINYQPYMLSKARIKHIELTGLSDLHGTKGSETLDTSQLDSPITQKNEEKETHTIPNLITLPCTLSSLLKHPKKDIKLDLPAGSIENNNKRSNN